MTARKRYALFALGTVALVIALIPLHRETEFSPEFDLLLVIGGGMAGAAMLAGYQYSGDAERYDERGMYIRYRSAYIGFWAVYTFLIVFTIGGYGGVLPNEPYAFVASAWALGTVSMGATRLWYRRKF